MSEQAFSGAGRTGAPAAARGRAKERVGVVTSNAMDKTVTVAVERQVEHVLYQKGVKRTKKFKAHDKDNACQVGDTVRIRETRPLSKTKRWKVVEVVKRVD
jgi:small subunit ribosomal protein S17